MRFSPLSSLSNDTKETVLPGPPPRRTQPSEAPPPRRRIPAAPPSVEQPLPPEAPPYLEQQLPPAAPSYLEQPFPPSNTAARRYAGNQSIGRAPALSIGEAWSCFDIHSREGGPPCFKIRDPPLSCPHHQRLPPWSNCSGPATPPPGATPVVSP